MARIRNWAGMFIVSLALALVLVKVADVPAETAEAASSKTIWVGSPSFKAFTSASSWTEIGNYMYGEGIYFAPVNVPVGKKIIGITLNYLDNLGTGDEICIGLYRHLATDDSSITMTPGLCSSGSSSSPASVTYTMPTAYKVLANDIFRITATFDANSASLRLISAGVLYK